MSVLGICTDLTSQNHGANAARVRVWTAGTYSTDFAINLGRRIKATGMTLIVDLHFSDTCESKSTVTR